MYILDNIDTIFKDSINQIMAMGKEETIREEGIKPVLGSKRSSSKGDVVESMADQILKNARL
jgi:hypothetical protein